MAEVDALTSANLAAKRRIKSRLTATFNASPAYRKSFYRYLSHDGCNGRHNILEPQTLEKFCPLDNNQHEEVAIPTQSMGPFTVLPLELLVAIFVDELDLATLTTMRCVSRGARAMVSFLPQYNTIYMHASASLRASLSLNTAALTSCRVLYETLCSPYCSCGSFGAFLYLPTYQRVCYDCFTTSMLYLPLTPGLARAKFALTSRNLANTPSIRSVPGNYRLAAGFGNWDRKRLRLMDMGAVLEVALTVHGTPENVYASHRQAYNDRIREWAQRTQLWQDTPEDDRPAQEPRRPPYTPDFDSGEFNSHRRMFIVGFPWFDRRTDTVEWGVACNGCKRKCTRVEDENKKKGPRLDRVLYTQHGLLDHLSDCKELAELMIKEHDKILDEARVWKNARGYCQIAGTEEARRDGADSNPSGCFLWHGRESY